MLFGPGPGTLRMRDAYKKGDGSRRRKCRNNLRYTCTLSEAAKRSVGITQRGKIGTEAWTMGVMAYSNTQGTISRVWPYSSKLECGVIDQIDSQIATELGLRWLLFEVGPWDIFL